MFSVNWNEDDFEELDFYDLFDTFYPKVFEKPVPYTADSNLGAGAVYHIYKEEFKKVIRPYFKIDSVMHIALEIFIKKE